MKNIHKYSIGGTVATGLSAAAPFITQGNHTALGDIAMGLGTAATAIPVVGQWLGPALVAAGALGNAAFGSNVNEQAVDDYNRQINNLNTAQFNARSNTDLLNQFASVPTININKNNLGTQGWFSHKIDNTYNNLQNNNVAAMAGLNYKKSLAASNVDKLNDALISANYAAFGGPLFDFGDGAIAYDMAKDSFIAKQLAAQNKNIPQVSNALGFGGIKFPIYDNGITFIGAGGTHGQNPFGGVLMGMAPDGQPNLVEEGEVIYNDYVYSNRLKVPKKLREKYHLKEGTFADAMNHYFKKNGVDERPNDPIVKDGLMAFASDLAMSQEEIKMRKEMKQMGLMANGGHLFPNGGPYIGYNREMGTENYEDSADYMRALEWLQQAENAEELRKLQSDITSGVYDDPEGPNKINGVKIDDSNWYRLATDRKIGPVHNAIMKWANANRGLWDTPESVATRESLGLPTVTMRYKGDATGKFDKTGRRISPEFSVFTDIDSARGVGAFVPGEMFQRGDIINQLSYDDSLKAPARLSDNRKVEGATGSGVLDNGLSGLARNAGLIANLVGLGYNVFDPYRPGVIDEVGPFNPITASPIGDYVDRYHTDTNYIGNQLAQEAAATRNAIMQSTLPSRIGGLLAADYNAQVARGNAIRDAGIADYETNLKGSEFNRGTNQYNSQLGLNVAQANMQGFLNNAAQRMQQRAYNISNYDRYKMGRDQAIGQGISGIANWFDADRRDRDAAAMLQAVINSRALETNAEMRDLAKRWDYGYTTKNGGKLKKKSKK